MSENYIMSATSPYPSHCLQAGDCHRFLAIVVVFAVTRPLRQMSPKQPADLLAFQKPSLKPFGARHPVAVQANPVFPRKTTYVS
jgi:hypothetical protein